MNTSKYKNENIQSKTQNINYEEYQTILEFKFLGLRFAYDNDGCKDVRTGITTRNRPYLAI